MRFLPTSNHTKVCIRVEIFGVTKKPGMLKGDLVSKPKHAHYGDCGRRDKPVATKRPEAMHIFGLIRPHHVRASR